MLGEAIWDLLTATTLSHLYSQATSCSRETQARRAQRGESIPGQPVPSPLQGLAGQRAARPPSSNFSQPTVTSQPNLERGWGTSDSMDRKMLAESRVCAAIQPKPDPARQAAGHLRGRGGHRRTWLRPHGRIAWDLTVAWESLGGPQLGALPSDPQADSPKGGGCAGPTPEDGVIRKQKRLGHQAKH